MEVHGGGYDETHVWVWEFLQYALVLANPPSAAGSHTKSFFGC